MLSYTSTVSLGSDSPHAWHVAPTTCWRLDFLFQFHSLFLNLLLLLKLITTTFHLTLQQHKMGSGASSAILQGPLDGSDLTDLNQAQAEVGKLRTVIHQYANQDWHEVANKASAEKKGWGIWNGKVLLAGASKQYDQPVTLEMGDCIPFNETSDWFKEGSADHWFNIPLNTPEIKKDTGMFIPGKLFTTRMPRGIDLEKNEEWPTETIDKVKNQGRTMRQYFEEKVKDEHITHAFVLVEIFEMEKVCSKSLLTYYESLGITVHHTPIVDFTAPALEIEAKNIEDLNLALVKGENCIVHCMGGTGRTGTVIVGAIQNLGFDHAIKHIRKYGKSTYLEIKEQEELIEAQSKVLTAKMM